MIKVYMYTEEKISYEGLPPFVGKNSVWISEYVTKLVSALLDPMSAK